MQLCLLHLDDALEQQHTFIKTCVEHKAHQINAKVDGANIRLWGKQLALDGLQEKISGHFIKLGDSPKLCFMGSGDFHHVTALLVAATVARLDKPVTIIHFDNHPDWVNFKNGMHCGSWVNKALSLPQVQKVITVGVCSKDLHLPEFKGANLNLLSSGKMELFPYHHAPSRVRKKYGHWASYSQGKSHLLWNTIEQLGEDKFLNLLLSRIKTDRVYITIDKDVLTHDDAITNWDQGKMRLPYLLEILKRIGASHNIIGADVNGDYSIPNYSGGFITKFLKHAEIFLDQPKNNLDIKTTTELNSKTNHTLFEVLSSLMS